MEDLCLPGRGIYRNRDISERLCAKGEDIGRAVSLSVPQIQAFYLAIGHKNYVQLPVILPEQFKNLFCSSF